MSSKQAEAYRQDEPPPAYDGSQQHPGYSEHEHMYPKEGNHPPPYPQQQYMGQGYPGQPQPVIQGQVMYGQGPQTMVVVTPGMDSPPDTHLHLAIFVTLCCCWPIGIFAILRASSCKSAIGQGDRTSAERLSREAKRFSMWALGIGIFFNVVSICVIVLMYVMYIIPTWSRY